MNILLIYFLLVFILAGVSLLVIASFWKYRFEGDRTGLVTVLFSIGFIVIVGATLLLIFPSSLNTTPKNTTTIETNFAF